MSFLKGWKQSKCFLLAFEMCKTLSLMCSYPSVWCRTVGLLAPFGDIVSRVMLSPFLLLPLPIPHLWWAGFYQHLLRPEFFMLGSEKEGNRLRGGPFTEWHCKQRCCAFIWFCIFFVGVLHKICPEIIK